MTQITMTSGKVFIIFCLIDEFRAQLETAKSIWLKITDVNDNVIYIQQNLIESWTKY